MLCRSALVVFLFGATAAAQPIWEATPGPSGGVVERVAEAAGGLYAASGNVVYRSADEGRSWHRTALLPGGVEGLLALGDTLWAITVIDGVFASDAHAATWAPKGLDAVQGYGLVEVEGELLAATAAGLFRRVPTGWAALGVRGAIGAILAVTYDARLGLLVCADERGAVFVSEDQGTNWETVRASGPYVVALAVAESGAVLAAGASGVSRFERSGEGWAEAGRLTVTGEVTDVRVTPGGTLWAPHYRGALYVSTDDGRTWAPRSVPGDVNFHSVRALASGDLLAGAYRGGALYRSADAGASWGPSNAGFASATVFAIAEKDDTYYAATRADGVHHSHDGGRSWALAGLRGKALTSIVRVGDVLLAGSTDFLSAEAGVYRSEDGETWTGPHLSGTDVADLAADPLEPSVAYLAGGGVYRSTDAGATWRLLRSGQVSVVAAQGQTVYIGTLDTLLLSEDAGETWRPAGLTFGLLDHPTDLIVTPEGGAYVAAISGVYYRPGPAGAWEALGLSYARSLFYDAAGGTLYGTSSSREWSGVYAYRPQEGWSVQGLRDLSGGTVVAATADGHLLAGMVRLGIWRSTAPVVANRLAVPEAALAATLFPNPTLGPATLRLSLAAPAAVTVEVFDVLGRRVEALGERALAAGEHSVEVGRPLPPGVYVVRWRIDEQAGTRRLTVVR